MCRGLYYIGLRCCNRTLSADVEGMQKMMGGFCTLTLSDLVERTYMGILEIGLATDYRRMKR